VEWPGAPRPAADTLPDPRPGRPRPAEPVPARAIQ
jgi:hypothetical protein